MELLIWIAVIVIFIVLTLLVKALKVLLLNPLRTPHFMLADVSSLPKHLKPLYALGHRELKKLGFKGFCVFTHESMFQHVESTSWVVTYWHPQHRCYAFVTQAHSPTTKTPIRVTFAAYQHGIEYSGLYKEANSLFKEYPKFIAKDNNHSDLSVRFIAYIEDLNQQVSTAENQFYKPQQLLNRHAQSLVDYYDFLKQKNYVKQQGDLLNPTWKGALALIAQIIRHPDAVHDDQKLDPKELIHDQHALIAAEVHAYQHHHDLNHNPQFNNWVKTLIFMASAVFFAVLFGTTFSYTMLLALIPVLLFHELGHYVMMKLFKYQDLQILFIPLGAAVTGKEQNTSVIKKVLVYLAGPAPGLILAYVFYAHLDVFADVSGAGFMMELALMAFIINYFNLLPIKPLDGGQIFDLVLFSRMPVMQLVFQIISVLAFVLLAMWLSGTLLYVLAIFLTFTLIGEIKNTRLKLALKDQEFNNEDHLLSQLFWQLRTESMTYEQRRQVVEQVKPQLEQPKARWHEIALGLVLYLTLLLSPLYVVYRNFDWYGLDEQYSSEYWQKQVDEQDTVNGKLTTYYQAFEVLAHDNQLFFEDRTLLDEALTFLTAHHFKQEPLYAELLKQEFLLTFYNNSEKINQSALNLVISELGTDHPVLGEIYVAINSIAFNPNSQDQLTQAALIAERSDDLDLRQQALNTLANYQTHQGQYKSSIATTQQLLSIDPELANYWQINLGYLHLLDNDADKAAATFQTMINQADLAFDVVSSAHQGLGWVHLAKQEWHQAALQFRTADQILAEQFEANGLDFAVDEVMVEHHEKWLVLHWLEGNQAAFDQRSDRWLALTKRYGSLEAAMQYKKDLHPMASAQQIYTHTLIIEALESVQ